MKSLSQFGFTVGYSSSESHCWTFYVAFRTATSYISVALLVKIDDVDLGEWITEQKRYQPRLKRTICSLIHCLSSKLLEFYK